MWIHWSGLTREKINRVCQCSQPAIKSFVSWSVFNEYINNYFYFLCVAMFRWVGRWIDAQSQNSYMYVILKVAKWQCYREEPKENNGTLKKSSWTLLNNVLLLNLPVFFTGLNGKIQIMTRVQSNFFFPDSKFLFIYFFAKIIVRNIIMNYESNRHMNLPKLSNNKW